MDLAHDFKSESLQSFFTFSRFIFQHFLIEIVLDMSWNFFGPERLHSLKLFSFFFIKHFLSFLLTNGHSLMLVSRVKTKWSRNSDIESFVMGKGVLTSDLQNLVLLSLYPLLSD